MELSCWLIWNLCGDLAYAGHLSAGIPIQDVVWWTAMTAGCFQHGFNEDVLILLEQMRHEGVKPNQFTYTSVLRACAGLEAL